MYTCQLLIGQAKLVIEKSHQCKNSGENESILTLFKSLVESRVVIEYTYIPIGGALGSVCDSRNCFLIGNVEKCYVSFLSM